MYNAIRFLFIKISGGTREEKGIKNLERAFSCILIKDKKSVGKYIRKAKKYLGDIPIISWLEGQLLILEKDNHNAKALFYNLCAREQGTVLGAHGLCKMSIDNDSKSDTLNAINSILKTYPNAFELAFQAVAIALKIRDFVEAKKHISTIRKTKKGKIVEAVIYAIEGDEDSIKRAFKLAPELWENALNYAKHLSQKHEYRKARDVLLTSFKLNNIKILYDAYISCGNNSDVEKLKSAEKVVDSVDESWIPYFGLADLAFKMGMYQVAFANFKKAYLLEQFSFIAEMLIKSAKKLEESGLEVDEEFLNNPMKSKKVEFVWKCDHCGYEDADYDYICKNCSRIAEYKMIYKISESSKVIVSGLLE